MDCVCVIEEMRDRRTAACRHSMRAMSFRCMIDMATKTFRASALPNAVADGYLDKKDAEKGSRRHSGSARTHPGVTLLSGSIIAKRRNGYAAYLLLMFWRTPPPARLNMQKARLNVLHVKACAGRRLHSVSVCIKDSRSEKKGSVTVPRAYRTKRVSATRPVSTAWSKDALDQASLLTCNMRSIKRICGWSDKIVTYRSFVAAKG